MTDLSSLKRSQEVDEPSPSKCKILKLDCGDNDLISSENLDTVTSGKTSIQTLPSTLNDDIHSSSPSKNVDDGGDQVKLIESPCSGDLSKKLETSENLHANTVDDADNEPSTQKSHIQESSLLITSIPKPSKTPDLSNDVQADSLETSDMTIERPESSSSPSKIPESSHTSLSSSHDGKQSPLPVSLSCSDEDANIAKQPDQSATNKKSPITCADDTSMKCGICHSNYRERDPLLLGCLHIFCGKCILSKDFLKHNVPNSLQQSSQDAGTLSGGYLHTQPGSGNISPSPLIQQNNSHPVSIPDEALSDINTFMDYLHCTDYSVNKLFIRCPVCDCLSNAKAMKNNLFSERKPLATKVSSISSSENSDSTLQDSSQSCTCCEENHTAVSYCKICDEKLCEECVNAHKRVKITKEHVLESLETPVKEQTGSTPAAAETTDVSLFCEHHASEVIKLFCETCNILTCRDCQLSVHREHKYQFISEAAESQRKLLETLRAKLQEKRLYLQKTMQTVEKSLVEVGTRRASVLDEVKSFHQRLIEVISDKSKYFTEKVENVTQKREHKLKLQLSQTKRLCAAIDHSLDFVDLATQKQNGVALLHSKTTVMEYLNAVMRQKFATSPVSSSDLCFKADAEILQIISSRLGSLYWGVPAATVMKQGIPPGNHPAQPTTYTMHYDGGSRMVSAATTNMSPFSSAALRHQSPGSGANRLPTAHGQAQPHRRSTDAPVLQPPDAHIPSHMRVLTTDGSHAATQPRIHPVQQQQQQQTIPSSHAHPTRHDSRSAGAYYETGKFQQRQTVPNKMVVQPRMHPNTQSASHQLKLVSRVATQSTGARNGHFYPQHHPKHASNFQPMSQQQRYNFHPMNFPETSRGMVTSVRGFPPTSSYPEVKPFVTPSTSHAYVGAHHKASEAVSAAAAASHVKSESTSRPQLHAMSRFPAPVASPVCSAAGGSVYGHHHHHQQSPQHRQSPMSGISQSYADAGGLRFPDDRSPSVGSSACQTPPDASKQQQRQGSGSGSSGFGGLQSGISSSASPYFSANIHSSSSSSSDQNRKQRKRSENDGAMSPPPLMDLSDFIKVEANDEYQRNSATNAARMSSNRPMSRQQKRRKGSTDSDRQQRTTIGDSGESPFVDLDRVADKFDPNEDWCAVCKNGGDLLCCDTCPKVYHLHCHVPELSNTPPGSWQCLLCRDLDASPEVEVKKQKRRITGLSGKDQRLCEKVLLLIYSHPLSIPFHRPVKSSVPNYYKVIRNPMDLQRVRKKLQIHTFNVFHYESFNEFINDILLIFKNCYDFNGEESELGRAARKVHVYFLQQVSLLLGIDMKLQVSKLMVPHSSRMMPSTPPQADDVVDQPVNNSGGDATAQQPTDDAEDAEGERAADTSPQSVVVDQEEGKKDNELTDELAEGRTKLQDADDDAGKRRRVYEADELWQPAAEDFEQEEQEVISDMTSTSPPVPEGDDDELPTVFSSGNKRRKQSRSGIVHIR